MAAILARDRPVITDENLNPIVQIITWLLLAINALTLTFRATTRCYLKNIRHFSVEDVLMFMAFLFSIGESIAFLVPKSNALGKSIQEIPSVHVLVSSLKAQYAGQLLFIVALTFAKLSVSFSLHTLSPVTSHKRIIRVACIVIILWGLGSFLATAFQCGARNPWNYVHESCVDIRALNYFVGIMNMLTDLGLIIIPILIILPRQMALETRLTIIFVFSLRTLAIAATIAQITFLSRWTRTENNDFTLRMFPWLISMQVVQCTSLSTACIAYLWPFLKSLRSGKLWAEDVAQSTYNRSTFASDPNASNISSQNRTRENYIKITTQDTISTTRIAPSDAARLKHDMEHSYQARWQARG